MKIVKYSTIISNIVKLLNEKIEYFQYKITEEYVKIYLLYIYIITMVSIFFLYLLPMMVAAFFIILISAFVISSTYENSQSHYEAVSILFNKEYNDTLIEVNSIVAKEYSIEPGYYYERLLQKNGIYVYSEEIEQTDMLEDTDIRITEQVDIDKKIRLLELELELAKLKNT